GTLTLAHNNAAGTSSIAVSSTTGGAGVTGTRVALQGSVTVANVLSLPSNATGDIRSNLFSTSGSNTWGGPITLNGTGTIAFAGNAVASLSIPGGVSGTTFSGSLAAARGAATFTDTIASTVNLPSGALSITDGATAVVTSTGNTWTSTSLLFGTLKLGATSALPSSTTVSFGQAGSSGVLDLGGFNQQVAGLTVAGGATAASQKVGNS